MNYHNIITLAVGAIIVDTIVGYILLFNKKSGKTIRQWYSQFTIGAYTMDITSLVIGTFLATLLTSNYYLQFVYVVIIGLIHDTSFALFLNNVNTKGSKILQFFKDYAKEYGKKILLVDALMLISTLVVSNVLINTFSNTNIVFLGVLFSYFGLLMIYSF
jgi:SNF family Na+-dependent transporter